MPRKKKQKVATVDGAVAGLLRKSKVVFPDGCETLEDRTRYVDDLRRIRMSELIADAERDGETITVWYDDMGISGTGQYVSKRTGLARLNKDVKEGKIRLLYSRDLSRLYRAVKFQEFWFDEMAEYGCDVRCADLPRNLDPAATRFQRQLMGSFHEYDAARKSVIFSANIHNKVELGLWVGRTRDVWGLTYNRHAKGFDYDPETAPCIIRLFEEFVRHGGVAGRVVEALNRQIMRGDLDALLTPTGVGMWHNGRVLQMIKSPLYRRCTSICEFEYERPEQIPEVVPLELVLEAQRLADLRSGRAGTPAKRIPFTYSGLLRCGYCGHPMRAGSCEGPAGAIYRCSRARQSRALCPDSFGICSPRLDDMFSNALRAAIESRTDVSPKKPPSSSERRARSEALSIEKQVKAIDGEMERLFLVYSGGKSPFYTYPRYEADMVRLQAKKEMLQKESGQEINQALAARVLTVAELQILLGALDQTWNSDIDPSNIRRSQMLRSLQVVATITVRPRVRERPQRARERRRTAGLAVAEIVIPALGYGPDNPIVCRENEETFRRWQRGSPKMKDGICGKAMCEK